MTDRTPSCRSGDWAFERYEDPEVEILRHHDTAIVKNKVTRRIYQVAGDALPPKIPWAPTASIVSNRLFYVYAGTLTALLIPSLASAFTLEPTIGNFSLNRHGWTILIGYFCTQMAVHELSHILALKAFGRRPDRVGFKMNFGVFPAFYVRMNDTHLLLPPEKFIIHTAGLFSNSLVSTTLLVFNSAARDEAVGLASSLFAYGLWANAMPILRSDGQKALFAILGIIERRRLRENSAFVIGLYVASWMVAAFLSIDAIGRLI